jgi:hypothetical protein
MNLNLSIVPELARASKFHTVLRLFVSELGSEVDQKCSSLSPY